MNNTINPPAIIHQFDCFPAKINMTWDRLLNLFVEGVVLAHHIKEFENLLENIAPDNLTDEQTILLGYTANEIVKWTKEINEKVNGYGRGSF